MAFSSKRINAYDVAQMCGVEHDEAAFVLNGLYPIIVCEGDRYFAFHNDVRLFLTECNYSQFKYKRNYRINN